MRILVPILCTCLFAQSISALEEELSDLRLISDRCRTLLLREGESAQSDARNFAAAVSKDGSWPDIDYEDRDPAGWRTFAHLSRTRVMAMALAKGGNGAREAADLRRAVFASLDHWIEKRYRSPNWWWNQIGVPRAVRDIVMLLGDDLAGQRRTGAIEVIGQHKLRGTGANLMWSAELSLHHGCLTQDVEQAAKAADHIWKEIKVGAREGIQNDWSFFQHGPRLQMYHYGRGYLDVVCKIGWQTRGTPWEMPGDKRDIISRFIIDGMQWMCRGPHTVPGTIDRAVSRKGSLHLGGLDALVQIWREVDAGRSGDLDAFLNRLRGTGAPLVGFRHFPRADFTAYHRPDGSFFLKTLSNRTRPTESINNENLKGKPYLHCGDLYTLRDGREYGDLQPLWIWDQLPGLTRAEGLVSQERREFVGGMGDGASGLTAMDYKRFTEGRAIEVRKLWAFHGDAVLCLLGGWETTGPVGDITTSIEQCRLRGPVEQPDKARWVLHGGFGYLALGDASLEVRRRRATGSWNDINRRHDPQEITEEVLHVDLCHGSDPRPAGFAIVLGANRKRIEGLAAAPEWRVLRNDRECQCVRFESGLHMGAFYAPAKAGAEEGLQVDGPCLAMWSREASRLCDPTHRGTEVSVKWNDGEYRVVLPPAAGIVRIDPSAQDITLNEKDTGYRGIWYMNQPSRDEYVFKYSGGLGTYCAKHQPFAVYCKEVNKTFFCYGGALKDDNRRLLHMVSYFDHETGTVPRPTILLDKKTDDAHDNPVISVDDDGFIWIFSTSHGTSRPSYIHRSAGPYDIERFELVQAVREEGDELVPIRNFSYMQAWYVARQGFICFFTKYRFPAARTICCMTSPDGIRWSAWQRLAAIDQGHYQISGVGRDRAGSAFNFHPEGKGLNWRSNLYYVETTDFGKTWRAADGTLLALPLEKAENPALVREYRSEGLNVYLKDILYDADDRPVILYLTSKGFESGPKNDPRTWMTARWTGKEWDVRPVTTSDNNYDMGSLWILDDSTWHIVAPLETGPQPYNTGGEIALWTSNDRGAAWRKTRQLTRDSLWNHTYVRRPLNAHPDFFALWADGHGREPSESCLYFCDLEGRVYRLPRKMTKAHEKPEPLPGT